MADARAADQRVHIADAVKRRFDGLTIRHVTADWLRTGLAGYQMRGGVVLLIQEKNPVSPGGKQADCRRADAPAPTGNHSG